MMEAVMTDRTSRRTFVRHTSAALAALPANLWLPTLASAQTGSVEATTSAGRIRGTLVNGIRIFKGVPYGATTAGANRFKPPTRPAPWTGVRDALTWGPTAPQSVEGPGARSDQPPESEDCLVLNVYTPALGDGRKRPVMVWLHGGGFSTGSASRRVLEGTRLAAAGDVVVVTINHRLNVFGFTPLVEALGPEFAGSSAAGLVDIVAALEWVRDNVDRFGGDPNLVTIFGQSGGGRKVAALMAMPAARGLFHRAIVESGAILRLTDPAEGRRYVEELLTELGVEPGQAHALQQMPVARLLQANAAVIARLKTRPPGWTANSPIVDGTLIPSHPWDPAAPMLSSTVPLLIGWARTEETWYDRPTPEKLALDEAGLAARVKARLGTDPQPVIQAYRRAYPSASPWDLHILIATDHPRGTYARELARRKAVQGGAPAFLYRFDWETPEGGGHMRSPHTVEVPFVFDNIAAAGSLIAKRADAHALAATVSASWMAFARTGDPNVTGLPTWPAYSAARRDTMLITTESRVAQDPEREARVAMERVLGLG
jgi:para-nitrobenzyl esterase